MPRSSLAPGADSVLPPGPVLHLFSWRAASTPLVRIEAYGRDVAFEREVVSETRDVLSERISIPVGRGDLTVFVDGEAHHYRIDPHWSRGPARTVNVTRAEHDVWSWTCSHTDAFYLWPSVDAPAYRVEWARTADDYRQGRRQSLVVPHDPAVFFADPDATALIGLGFLSCLGETFDPAELPVYVGVTALHPDGSEDDASPEPAVIGPAGAFVPHAVADPAAVPIQAVGRCHAHHRVPAIFRFGFVYGPMLVLLALALMMLLPMRRRPRRYS